MDEAVQRADPNASDQRAAWNGSMGDRWLSNHRLLDRMLTPFGDRLVEAVGDLAGASVLDVGCGAGETSARLADLVGSTGRVTGVDISESLIAHARATHEAPSLEFVASDASTVMLGSLVDAVMSRFGMMFFPDPGAALAHLRRCMADGGCLVTAVWQAPKLNEWVRRPLQAAASVIELPPPPPADAPGPFAFADAGRVEALLEGAGFADISIEPFEPDVTIGADARSSAQFLLNVLPTGPLLDSLSAEESERVVDVVASALSETDGVVHLGAAAHVIVAT